MRTKVLLSVLVLLPLLAFRSLPDQAPVVQTAKTERIPSASDPSLLVFQKAIFNAELPRIALPDLVASGMQVAPEPATQGEPVYVQVKVTNRGVATFTHFSVQWWASWAVVGCNWSVMSLASGESKTLNCTYTYRGWNNAYSIREVVDSLDLVNESNEGNNSRQDTLRVLDAP